nr:hypothetical protein [Tanacetum cinerariifolium]
MRRVGKGFLRVETPLFEGADTAVEGDDVHEPSIPSPTPPTPPPQQYQDLPSTSQEALDACTILNRRVEHLEYDKVAQALEINKLKRRVKQLKRGNKVKVLKLIRLKKVGTSQRIESFDDNEIEDASNQERMTDVLMVDKEDEKKTEDAMGAGDDQEDEPKVQEVVDVVTTGKLITEVVSAASESVPAASITIADVGPQVLAATITAAPVRVAAASTKRRKGVVIRDPEEESTAIIPVDTKKLHEELNKNIDWDVAIDHVKQKAKEDQYVQRYQVIKKRPQTEAQAQRNMIMYLKNVAGFRLDYFKGMSYDDIRPIFEAKFNSNIEFLLKSKEQIEEEENKAIQSINETPAQKAAKRRKLNKEVEDLKQHLEIVPDEDDDVYTEATPLAKKVPVVDYEIIHFNNKPHHKIIRADGTHQLYVSFITLLKNFDREDLESLWCLVKERFSTSKPNNFSDDYLLTTLGVMFERLDEQAQLILLVERRYPLSRFTLDQMQNAVRLRVEEQSEMALELLSFEMDAAMDHEENTKCLMLLNRWDLPKDTPIDRLEVLRYDIGKRSKVRMRIMPTETELSLEQTQQVDKTKKFLSSRFLMKDMGEADVILGIKIKRKNKGIGITQSHYIEKILKKFNREDCSPVRTPMDPVEKLKPNTGKPVDQLEYSRAIGFLMYAMTSTRSDIAYAIGRLSYSDASWINHVEDSSSTSGWVFLLGGEAEWLRNLLEYSRAIGCLMYAMKSTRPDIAYVIGRLRLSGGVVQDLVMVSRLGEVACKSQQNSRSGVEEGREKGFLRTTGKSRWPENRM